MQIKRCRFSMKDSDGVDGAGCDIFKGAQGEYWLIERLRTTGSPTTEASKVRRPPWTL